MHLLIRRGAVYDDRSPGGEVFCLRRSLQHGDCTELGRTAPEGAHKFMLFQVKLDWRGALALLVVLGGGGLLLRPAMPYHPPYGGMRHLLVGAGAAALMLAIDGSIHAVAGLLTGQRYLDQFRRLHRTFAGQSWAAIVAGSFLAGFGEEMVFRGLDARPAWLLISAVAFGLCHRCRQHSWYFTLWSVWEGVALGLLVMQTGALLAAMAAHTLHDLLGFAYFRRLNQIEAAARSCVSPR